MKNYNYNIDNIFIDAIHTHQEIFDISRIPSCFSFSLGGKNTSRLLQFTDEGLIGNIFCYHSKVDLNDYVDLKAKIHQIFYKIIQYILKELHFKYLEKIEVFKDYNYSIRNHIDNSILILNKEQLLQYRLNNQDNYYLYHNVDKNQENLFLNQFDDTNVILKGKGHIHLEIIGDSIKEFNRITFKTYYNFYNLKVYTFKDYKNL